MKVEARYWRRAQRVGRQVYRSLGDVDVDEQAGPAYFAGLWLSRQVFWQRLAVALSAIPAGGRNRCLDFGCGFGLLLPVLSQNFHHVTGIDLRPELSEQFLAAWQRDAVAEVTRATSTNVPVATNATASASATEELETADAEHRISVVSNLEQADLKPGSVDLIVALDVLEHITPLAPLLQSFQRLLSDTGQLLVSGPSESWCYRFGRRIVGFSGEYHVSDVYAVERDLKTVFETRRVRRWPPVPVLFEILLANK